MSISRSNDNKNTGGISQDRKMNGLGPTSKNMYMHDVGHALYWYGIPKNDDCKQKAQHPPPPPYLRN